MTNAPTGQTLADALRGIAGYVLSSVTFVRDYVQFAFDGAASAGLTAYTPPTVSCGPGSHIWGEPGYRDALCRQIGCRIERTAVDDQQVSIAFESGATVLISLRDADYRGPEALQLLLDKDRIWVV
jgi:hypothetical protein